MTVTLYKIDDPNNLIRKAVGSGTSIGGTMRQACDVESPVITIDISTLTAAERSAVLNANYMYIAEFGRYYFITNRNYLTDKLYELSTHVDVLMTYQDQIMNQEIIVDRAETYYTPHIVDSQKHRQDLDSRMGSE